MTMERTGLFRDVAVPLNRRGVDTICAPVEWSVVGGAKAMGSLPRANGLMPSWHKCKEYRQHALRKQCRLIGQNCQDSKAQPETAGAIRAAKRSPAEPSLLTPLLAI